MTENAPESGGEKLDATEAEEARLTAGQRRINVIWEITQAGIALMVSGTAMFTASILSLRHDSNADIKAITATAFLLISNAAFLVIGFYFGRTNHTRTGGPSTKHEGR